ncbi:MAG: PorV/PorQ family protein [candidate division KSB1 bacterium]|nr:PorV/PorQ family protein [candidate division KSB1 bacterium]MDZ7296017.1 PorV/PorQ family protein [candidate division KSB1 bacterium]
MKVSRTVGLVLVFLLLVASMAAAGQLRKPGIDGAAFLKIGVGARMVALGSAATTIYGDPNQIFWNPAGIQTDAGKTLVGLNYNKWLIDINHTALAVTHGLGDVGSFGLGVIYMGLSDLTADRDLAPPGYEEPVPEAPGVGRYDTYNYYDLAVTLGYSKQFTDRFRMGLAAKYIRESIDNVAANAWAFDFGAVYETGFRDLTFGARINNVGSDLKFYAIGASLPLYFAIGASMSVAKEENTALKAFVDLTKPKDSPQLYFVGGEWTLYDKLALRAGYKFNYSGFTDELTRLKQTDEGASFGAGLALPISGMNLWLDYAFTQFTVFDNTHRFSLRFQF